MDRKPDKVDGGRHVIESRHKKDAYSDETRHERIRSKQAVIDELRHIDPSTPSLGEKVKQLRDKLYNCGSCGYEDNTRLKSEFETAADKYVYVGKQPYISRFVGDRAAFVFGDTGICGKDNLSFITDIGNGLAKTATENYLTTYAFLVSLRLIVRKNDPSDLDIYYLLNAPMHWSDEDNIREFFEKCLWESVWNLENAISLMRDRVRKLERNGHGVFVNGIPQPKDGTMLKDNWEAPYVFLSYSHDNIEEAMDVVSQLQADGVRVWYDDRISPGSHFDSNIESRIKQCSSFIALLSHDYQQSDYCLDEIFYAIKVNRIILPVYLEEIQLINGLCMRLSRVEEIYKYQYSNAQLFYEKLYSSKGIFQCRCSERKADA